MRRLFNNMIIPYAYRFLTKKFMIISILFLVFLFLRLFVDSPIIPLFADSLKFLELARNFPYHTLSNNQLYLQHGILYPYTIHFVNQIINPDYIASLKD